LGWLQQLKASAGRKRGMKITRTVITGNERKGFKSRIETTEVLKRLSLLETYRASGFNLDAWSLEDWRRTAEILDGMLTRLLSAKRLTRSEIRKAVLFSYRQLGAKYGTYSKIASEVYGKPDRKSQDSVRKIIERWKKRTVVK
jgi:hypothetical protein